jgi:hypothetical protein
MIAAGRLTAKGGLWEVVEGKGDSGGGRVGLKTGSGGRMQIKGSKVGDREYTESEPDGLSGISG